MWNLPGPEFKPGSPALDHQRILAQHSEIAKHKLYAAEGKDQNVLSFPQVLMNMENDKILLHTHLHNY